MEVRGKPFEPGNKFSRGRPRGSRNKTNQLARELLDRYAEPLVRKLLHKALQEGDNRALQLCLARALPARTDRLVKIGKLPMQTVDELAKASEAVTQKVTTGKLTPDEGLAIAELIEKRGNVIELKDIDRRLRVVEAQQL